MERSYEFRFEITIADYEAYNIFITDQAFKKAKISRYIIAGSLLLLAGFNFYKANFTLSPSVVFTFLLAILWGVIIPASGKYGVKKRARKIVASTRPGVITGYREMSFSEKHITLVSDLFNETIQWGAIKKVARSKQHILVFISDMAAFIMPIKEIESQCSIEEFIAFVQSQIDQSQNMEEISAHLVKQ